MVSGRVSANLLLLLDSNVSSFAGQVFGWRVGFGENIRVNDVGVAEQSVSIRSGAIKSELFQEASASESRTD
jgi:hypothetical protein